MLLEQDNDSFEVGTSLWPSSLVLINFAERCLRDPALPFADVLHFPGARAFELGCGPAGLGLTDIAAVLPAVRRNRRLLPRAPRLAQLHWNCPAHLAALASRRRFDLVVAADAVYVPESMPHLVAVMDALADAERGMVLLGYQLRSPEAHQAFWDAVPTAFPAIEEVPREHLDPDYAYVESVCIYSTEGRGSEDCISKCRRMLFLFGSGKTNLNQPTGPDKSLETRSRTQVGAWFSRNSEPSHTSPAPKLASLSATVIRSRTQDSRTLHELEKNLKSAKLHLHPSLIRSQDSNIRTLQSEVPWTSSLHLSQEQHAPYPAQTRTSEPEYMLQLQRNGALWVWTVEL